MLIDSRQLQDWTQQLLEAWGYGTDDAVYVADTLVDANLRGVDSHGVIRLSAYRARHDAGLVDPLATPLINESGATVRIDANGAPGQIATRSAVNLVDTLSGEFGVAAAAVCGSTHFGAAGYYARALASRGKISIVVSNSEPAVVPFGGRDALLGTNPIAFAAPTSTDPICLDMATSTSAMGKVLVAQANGTPIPADWGVDDNGEPTTDPTAVKALLPAGGAKGYGLAFLVEILGGVLTGAAVAGAIGNMYTDFTKAQDVGHWMLAVDVAHFLPFEQFLSRIDRLVDDARAVVAAPGFGHVLVPGEPEEKARRARQSAGIALPESVVNELSALGTQSAIAFPGGGV